MLQVDCLEIFPGTNNDDVLSSAMECWDDITSEVHASDRQRLSPPLVVSTAVTAPLLARIRPKLNPLGSSQVRAGYAAKHSASQQDYDEQMASIALA